MDGSDCSEVTYLEEGDVRHKARRALRSHLHNEQPHLRSDMHQVLSTNANAVHQTSIKQIILANYRRGDNSVDIGCAFVMRNGCVMVYVRPAYRRCGIAAQLINRLRARVKDDAVPMFAWYTTAEAVPDAFWQKFNIPVLGERINPIKERLRGAHRTFRVLERG